MEDKLICWFHRNGKLLGAYGDIETAAKESGVNKVIIWRNLIGALNDCPDGSKFRYEITAKELLFKNLEEKKKKELEKAEKLWKEFGGE